VSNQAAGASAHVAGGEDNSASGDHAFAGGFRAIASAPGMFAWADSLPLYFDFATYRAPQSSNNTFNVRATGGVVFVTGVNASTGWPTWECYTYNGGGWTCSSDRNLKRNLTDLDGTAVLAKLMAMPIYQWQPKNGPNAKLKHAGPMAQDFYAAFGLGDSDRSIGMQDAEGVALSAIQGLYQVMLEKDAKIEAQQRTVNAQQREIDALKDRVASVESMRDEIAALRATMATTHGPTSLAATLH
jgi:hypothetical protein